MNKLDAVNEILEGIGQPSVTALDSTGSWPNLVYGSSDEASAERILDREARRILTKGGAGWGWAFTELDNYLIRFPSLRFTYSGSTPAFIFGETITQATTGATLQFNYVDAANKFIYAAAISGTPDLTNNNNLTGGTSAVTCSTVTAATTLSQGKIAFDATWLKVRPSQCGECKNLAFNVGASGAFIHDMSPSDSTLNPPADGAFTSDVRIDAVANAEFTTLPGTLANYVTQVAALRYQRFVRNSGQDDAELKEQLLSSYSDAMREDSEVRRLNMLDTADASNVRGNRFRNRPELMRGIR